jgi:hypothetical protein
MNQHQQTALTHFCRLACECCHPRFFRVRPGGVFSVAITVNTGYE